MPENPCETPACSGKVEAVPRQPQPWPIQIIFIPEPTSAGEQPSVGKPWAGVPTLHRLKKLLKSAKRGFGFRCVEIRTTDPEFAAAPKLVPPKRDRRKKPIAA